MKSALWEGLPLSSIHIGGVYASSRPSVVRTVLGSCVAVCLRDPVSHVGGMNHFMLPTGGANEAASARYGIHAMELLINACMREGADRRQLEAKVFGGGHVLRIRECDGNVPQSNIQFALRFLETERIPIVSRDLGGYEPREVYFFTETGRVLLKRIKPSLSHAKEDLVALERAERASLSKPAPVPAPDDDSNITLF
ncbi:MAG TPA: hypothetical protein VKU00_09795 [Chthonomonadaceae bacterium]|nr:hypothetical protein [Chthonomonadaceae bacterium]